MHRTRTWMAVIGVLALGLGAGPALAIPDHYFLLTTIPVPPAQDSTKFASYDISWFDGKTQTYYIADRSNASVDIFSAHTNTFIGRVGGFVGFQGSNDLSGPDGVLTLTGPSNQHELWAGDGPSPPGQQNAISHVLTFDLTQNGPPLIVSIPTGGKARSDEMAFDPRDHLVAVANNADTPPFLSLISSDTHQVVKQILFDGTNGTPNATNGIEQAVWDKLDKVFYISIPQINGAGPGGVSVIDPLGGLDGKGAVTKTFDLSVISGGGITACSPAGLAVANAGQLLIGCGDPSQTILFDPNANGGNGGIVKTFSQVSGEDEVWFDPTTGRCFVAARLNPGGPVLGIIDCVNAKWLQNVPTVPGAHSVAADPVSGEVFVPLGGVAGNNICPNGCIGVFSTPVPPTMLLLGLGGVGLGAIAWRRRRL